MEIEEILTGILIICSVMLFILLCIYFFAIYRKNEKKRTFNKINNYIQQNERDWYNYLVLKKPLPKHLATKNELEAIDSIFVSYVTSMNKEEILERASTYAALNMKNNCRAVMKMSVFKRYSVHWFWIWNFWCR